MYSRSRSKRLTVAHECLSVNSFCYYIGTRLRSDILFKHSNSANERAIDHEPCILALLSLFCIQLFVLRHNRDYHDSSSCVGSPVPGCRVDGAYSSTLPDSLTSRRISPGIHDHVTARVHDSGVRISDLLDPLFTCQLQPMLWPVACLTAFLT